MSRENNKIAIMSCIHGNMEALEAVYDDICSQDIDEIVCLGDLVGYGPYPNEVVEFIMKRQISTARGCWDDGIAKDNESCGCRYISEEEGKLGELAFSWTKDIVTKKTKDFLKQLPFGFRSSFPCGEAFFVHGSPRSTNEYLMHSTHELVLFERAAGSDCDILICGHTHVPFSKEVSGTLTVKAKDSTDDKTVSLSPKLIINAGSVGEPRHGGTESTYVTLDVETREVETRYVKYDVEKTVAAMRKQNIPEIFVERLLAGKEVTGKDKDITCTC